MRKAGSRGRMDVGYNSKKDRIFQKLDFSIPGESRNLEKKRQNTEFIYSLKEKATKGNRQAFNKLFQIAQSAHEALEEIAKTPHPAIVDRISNQPTWRVSVLPNGKLLGGDLPELKKLPVGNGWFFDPKRAFKTMTTSRAWLIRLIVRMHVIRYHTNLLIANRRKAKSKKYIPSLHRQIANLPPLWAETVDQWFELFWQVLLKVTDGCPANNSELRRIGIDQRAKDPIRKVDGIILDNIRKKLRRALPSMVYKNRPMGGFFLPQFTQKFE